MTTSGLAPGFLIAAPPLGDRNFDRSVVLLAAHGEDGAFGWIINGRDVMSVSELLVRADVLEAPVELGGSVRIGGPVSPEQVWLLYREQDRFANVDGQLEVGPGVVACASRRVLELIAESSKLPQGLFAVMGYAGWAPGQLENEIRGGAWLPADSSSELVFTEPREKIWHRAYERAGTTPMAFSSRVGLA